MSSSHILIVEDDPGDVLLAMSVLRRLQLEHRAVVVNDGEEAMDYLHSRNKFVLRSPEPPAFILLDLKLPRVNGFELLEQIKAHERFRYIPVVVLTSSQQQGDVEQAYGLGVNGYVVKSIDYSAYVATVRSVVLYWLAANEPPPLVSQCRSLLAKPHSAPLPASLGPLNAWLLARRWLYHAALFGQRALADSRRAAP